MYVIAQYRHSGLAQRYRFSCESGAFDAFLVGAKQTKHSFEQGC